MKCSVALLLVVLIVHASSGRDAFRMSEKMECVPSNASDISLLSDGEIVLKNFTSEGPAFSYITRENLTPKPFKVLGIDTLWDVWASPGQDVAIGSASGSGVLMVKRKGAAWERLEVPKELAKTKEAEIVPTDSGLAIFTLGGKFRKRILFVFRNSRWREIVPPESPFHTDFGYKKFLLGSKFVAGWCGGEWDLGVGVLDIDWLSYGWTAPVDSFGFGDISVNNITGMALNPKNELLICGDCSSGEMFSYNKRGFYSVPSYYRVPLYKRGQSIPDTTDVILGPDGKNYTVGQDQISVWNDWHFKKVIDFDFSMLQGNLRNPRNGKLFGGDTRCEVWQIAMDKSGNFFVGTSNFGVLCFLKHSGGYNVEQVFTLAQRKEVDRFYKEDR